jgi:hypothetical protein
MNKKLKIGAKRIFLMICFSLFVSVTVFAQKVRITGTVTDSNNEPIVGASVFEVGTQNGTVTDLDGNFAIQANQNARLRITYVGFRTVEEKAHDGMKVVLKDEANMLNEVVAIGYGTVKRKDVTTAVSSVSAKDLDARPIVSAVQGIQGKAAGVSLFLRQTVNLVQHLQSVCVVQRR